MTEARRFYEQAKTDPGLLYRIAAIEDPQTRLAAIRDEGFECTLAEISEAYREAARAGQQHERC